MLEVPDDALHLGGRAQRPAGEEDHVCAVLQSHGGGIVGVSEHRNAGVRRLLDVVSRGERADQVVPQPGLPAEDAGDLVDVAR